MKRFFFFLIREGGGLLFDFPHITCKLTSPPLLKPDNCQTPDIALSHPQTSPLNPPPDCRKYPLETVSARNPADSGGRTHGYTPHGPLRRRHPGCSLRPHRRLQHLQRRRQPESDGAAVAAVERMHRRSQGSSPR